MSQYYQIESRRYIGNKSKLNEWIMSIIQKQAPDAKTFCDIFAGTGTVSNQAVKHYKKIIINDLLFSNQVIYNAFFAKGKFDIDKLQNYVNSFNTNEVVEDNWFSESYGEKYFSMPVARKVGYIREQIEQIKPQLTDKEFNILLASLIYSIDRLANTVGHFEAYIKKPTDKNELVLQLIDAQSYENVEIYRNDANILARQITADIVYIDPPYNSRQYSRFYHVYETLVKWNKPELYGVARKPEPENLSEYCSSRALFAFRDLISHLQAKYIVVSYNNTYTSKSKSSQNKITLEQIQSVLEERGDTQVFTQKYNAFNAGKTDLADHKEYLFFTKMKNKDNTRKEPNQRPAEYKPLLYTTTVRNPMRTKQLLYALLKYNGQVLNDDLATEIVAETIRYGLYRPTHQTNAIKNKWSTTPKGQFAEQLLTDAELEYMLKHNPQNHKEAGFAKGFPSRFATIFDFAKELGFVYFTPDEPIKFSELGKLLANVLEVSVSSDGYISVESVHPEYEQMAFLQAMAKSQRKNPFVRVLNDNIPLILLVQVIELLNNNVEYLTAKGETKGISRKELPLLIFWKDNNAQALYERIVKLRNDFGYDPSDEVICDICTKEIMGDFKEFDMNSIMVDYPDEFIRKMRITGLFSLRGAGRFLDINHNEEEKVKYILEKYANYQHYTDEKAYFNYMAEIDTHLFEVESVQITTNQSEQLLQNWVSSYSWDTIQKEMLNLQKRTASKDSVLKLLAAPVRLEFLTALSIKCKLPNVRVIPNYACDDTGLPTSTAVGNMGDIECYEHTNGILVEVTMAEGRQQTVMEIWPIERHLTEFQDKTNSQAQAVFVAPSMFNDSLRQIKFVKADTGKVIRPYAIDEFLAFLNQTETLYA